jgi:hypothetical protein
MAPLLRTYALRVRFCLHDMIMTLLLLLLLLPLLLIYRAALQLHCFAYWLRARCTNVNAKECLVHSLWYLLKLLLLLLLCFLYMAHVGTMRAPACACEYV